MSDPMSPGELRRRVREGNHLGNTSGLAPGFVQCNIVILPAASAGDFHIFCQRNPGPCPLIAAGEPGDSALSTLGDIDIRTDVPGYQVFRDGEPAEQLTDISALWAEDMVTFALGCSFSFEEALIADGLEIRNITEGCNVPMYRTNIPCESSGPFESNMVVSMRPFTTAHAKRAVEISGRFPAVHGAPVHQGNPAQIGIADLSRPDFGDAITLGSDEIPLFWACGVTPQLALENARLPLAITHRPGCMLVTDLRNSQLAEL